VLSLAIASPAKPDQRLKPASMQIAVDRFSGEALVLKMYKVAGFNSDRTYSFRDIHLVFVASLLSTLQ